MNRFVPLLICAVALGQPAVALATAAPWANPTAASCSVKGEVCSVLTDEGRIWLSLDNGHTFQDVVYLPPPGELVAPEVTTPRPADLAADDLHRGRLSVPARRAPQVDQTRSTFGATPPRPRIAVSATGSFAAFQHGRLYYGRLGEKTRLLSRTIAVGGLIIDEDEFIWWISGNRLTQFSPQTGRSLVHQIASSAVRSLAIGDRPATLIITDEQGVWRLHLDPGTGAVTREPALLSRNISLAVAVPGSTDSFYVVRNNDLERVVSGNTRRLAPLPPRCTQLEAGLENIYLRCDGSWYRVSEHALRRTGHRGVARTSAGQVLLVGPSSFRLTHREKPSFGAGWNHRISRGLVLDSLARLDTDIGPPPCAPQARSLLPSVRLYATLSRFEDAQIALGGDIIPSIQTAFSGGILLSFEFEPIDHTRCRQAQERWQRFRWRTAEKIREYTREWVALHAGPPSGAGIRATVNRYIANQKIRSLISLYSEIPTVPIEE